MGPRLQLRWLSRYHLLELGAKEEEQLGEIPVVNLYH